MRADVIEFRRLSSLIGYRQLTQPLPHFLRLARRQAEAAEHEFSRRSLATSPQNIKQPSLIVATTGSLPGAELSSYPKTSFAHPQGPRSIEAKRNTPSPFSGPRDQDFLGTINLNGLDCCQLIITICPVFRTLSLG